MKALISIFIITLVSSASLALEVPVGDFQYTNTQASHTKHVHQLYHKSLTEKQQITDYRANGYTCSRKNSSMTECSKFIETNPNQIEFREEKLAQLSPVFSDFVESVEELSSADAVSIYEIKQENSSNFHQNTHYKAYDIKGSGLYVDLNKDSLKKVRFEVLSPRVLSTFSYQKEKISKREYHLHSLLSYYIK